jgi:cytochrome c-type biogenesis protein CcmH/NrfF
MHFRTSRFWTRAIEAPVLALAICFSLGVSDAGSRFDNLGHRLMCTCGCAQLLGECDHVGCPDRGQEMSELTTAIAAGETDKQILDDFAGKYGLTVLAAPPAQGFNLVAWIAPFAVFAAALLGTILLIKRWGGWGVGTQAAAQAPTTAEERARLEQIRRETSSEGGY